jgi:hypothetical protein
LNCIGFFHGLPHLDEPRFTAQLLAQHRDCSLNLRYAHVLDHAQQMVAAIILPAMPGRVSVAPSRLSAGAGSKTILMMSATFANRPNKPQRPVMNNHTRSVGERTYEIDDKCQSAMRPTDYPLDPRSSPQFRFPNCVPNARLLVGIADLPRIENECGPLRAERERALCGRADRVIQLLSIRSIRTRRRSNLPLK